MDLIEFIEVSTRGGGAALCLVLTVQILTPRPVQLPAIFGSLFLMGAAIYCIIALPVMTSALGAYIIPFKLIGMTSPAFFWLFVTALHDDNFKWRWWRALPILAIAFLYLICIPFPQWSNIAKIVQVAVVAVLMGLTVYTVQCCNRDDLVTSRRHFGRTMRWLVPIIAMAIIGIEVLETLETQAPFARIFVGALILSVGIVLMTSITSLRRTLFPQQAIKAKSEDIEGMGAADRIDLGRLRDLMEEGAYLNPGLSIGELAKQMNVPEHRLRKLINSGLGYRNFSAFINDHRIDEAKRRLARPNFAREQITGLAFDLGYISLAPFNRAFRERLGESPTEYREKTLNNKTT